MLYSFLCINLQYYRIFIHMNKKERHKIIIEILATLPIESQETLLRILQTKGIEVTQATLSRDIKELQVIKTPTADGSYLYKLNNNIPIPTVSSANLTAYGLLNIEFSGNLAVVKTRPGYAMGIAGEIDKKITNEIIGTVAGDDTILLIIREHISHQVVMDALVALKNE